MVSSRLLLVVGAAACAFAAYTAANVAMDRLARWVEVDQSGYLWWSEEWMQLFDADNFVGRGKGRVLLSGSSEAREGFLFDEFEAELDGFEVYNNAYSYHTLTALRLVLQYIEIAYGPTAMPQKIVVGFTPRFALNEPTIGKSYLSEVINLYSPFVNVDTESRPARLTRKGRIDSIVSRYRLLTHQSRRYRGALRGVLRASIAALAPQLSERYWVRRKLVPSKYHDLPPIDQEQQLKDIRRFGLVPPDPAERMEELRSEWATVEKLAADYDIDLYVVSMPQSTWMVDDFYEGLYDDYRESLRRVVGNTPFLDLAGFLKDEDFYDVTHANLAASRRVSRRVAQFVRDSGEMKTRRSSKHGSNHDQ